MTIKPKQGILLVKKHNKSQLTADIAVTEDDNDKRLITVSIIDGGTKEYPNDTTVILGKYALYLLTLQNEDYYFCHIDDVIASSDYYEDV